MISYMCEEVVLLEKDISYYKNYRYNLKKFIFEMISEKPKTTAKYYRLLEEVDRITLKIEALKKSKNDLE